ncbi:16S rRNA (uracil(1498)-N(3))-methyltransferase [Lacihabitans sp. LS3-19]|uniref:RsmE family RNA methyltransferase n=1 Tax=Lacihabitans sp. LS3-19 TaxID=2487335 RepID=UPI0020CD05C2|nr:RsmE family RNA methyltransferase [Lacihabitans sp. LS3-19]MCP9769817.1 16S rRNA (uracil(1498)-N(3))-methyltransferase [Lacihabitans sp. LS3-19]
MVSKTKIDFLFYCPDIEKNRCLDLADSMHVAKVLRKKQGDIIQITDGVGGWYRCAVSDPNPKACKFEILEEQKEYNKAKREIYIAICPTKNADRIEYFIEKSIEIGVSGIFFLKTQNTYPKKINNERFRKIAISAMKQSLKAYLPFLSELILFSDFLKKHSEFEQKVIAHLANDAEDIISLDIKDKILVLIGPEGDFSTSEIQMAKESGFKNITLGQNRLRTETAGVLAASILNLKL